MAVKQPWPDVVQAKLQSREDAISAGLDLAGYGEPFESVVSNYDVGSLLQAYAARRVTCEAVTKSFIKKSCEVHRATNCFTEIAFRDAIERAKQLDKRLAEDGKPIGPLHGVPVTLKDQFDLKGYDTTLGYVGRAFDPASQNGVLVKILLSLGAVIIGKTNLPQSIMWCETENPLWGLTTHPTDKTYTPGGSTGGEAVLLAGHGSLLGWGTDIGGSIRIPSQMMGIYGFKPSSPRLPYRGAAVSTDGQEHVPSTIGPMARSLETIELAMRAVIGAQPWLSDARCVPLPWRSDAYEEMLSRPLTIGVLYDDQVIRPHPPLTRVMAAAIDVLQSAGHDVVEWNADLHAECIEVMDAFYTADGGQDIRDAVNAGGEPFIPHVQKLIDRAPAISVYDYWQLNKRKFALQQAYLDKWNSIRSPRTGRQVDVVLMPPMPHTAVPHRSCRWVGYTKIWNFLDYSALVIPGGKVEEGDLQAPWAHEARNSTDEWNANLWRDNKYQMAALKLPVGLQLVCRKLEEEKLLGAGKVIDALLETT